MNTLSPVTKQNAENSTDQKSEMEEQAKSRLNAGSGSLIEQQQAPILKQGRRGIKRPDITVQENDKKRPRKRKRWWSGCKQFVDFLFMKKHESNIIYRIHHFNKNVNLEFAFPFYEPVDHIALKLTDYAKIIKSPMDMGTIKKKLESDQYAEYKDVYSDLKQMFDNCYLYNPPTDNIVKLAKALEQLAEKRFNFYPLGLLE